MRYFFPVISTTCGISMRKTTLILSWFAGLYAGLTVAVDAGNISSLMRTCLDSRVTIVGLLMIPILPFLLSALAVFYSHNFLLYPIGFAKAFCFSMCAGLVTIAYGSAGCLIRMLLLFTDTFTIPVLCWYWLKSIDGRTKGFFRDTSWCVVWSLCVAFFDYIWIVPLLREIL